MDEKNFLRKLNTRAEELNINPLLLLSGIEGLYTFRDVEITAVNYEFIDSLILTIFALRIGDGFHTIAENNLSHTNAKVRMSASLELKEFTPKEIQVSTHPFLPSLAVVLQGKSPIRKYHEKALEAAALEINNVQARFNHDHISRIIMEICKKELTRLGLAELFTGKDD
jgi:hypothetical protein